MKVVALALWGFGSYHLLAPYRRGPRSHVAIRPRPPFYDWQHDPELSTYRRNPK